MITIFKSLGKWVITFFSGMGVESFLGFWEDDDNDVLAVAAKWVGFALGIGILIWILSKKFLSKRR